MHQMLASCILWSSGLSHRSVWLTSWGTVYFSWRTVQYGQFTSYAIVTFRKFRHKTEFSIHGVRSVSIQGSSAEIQIPAHWNMIDYSMAARLFYRPPVFFRHLRLISLSFSQVRIRNAFQKLCHSFVKFLNCVSLKFSESGSVCS
jgi:hypothetical protein